MSELFLHELSLENAEQVKDTVRMLMAHKFSEDKIKIIIHEAYAIEHFDRVVEGEL